MLILILQYHNNLIRTNTIFYFKRKLRLECINTNIIFLVGIYYRVRSEFGSFEHNIKHLFRYNIQFHTICQFKLVTTLLNVYELNLQYIA